MLKILHSCAHFSFCFLRVYTCRCRGFFIFVLFSWVVGWNWLETKKIREQFSCKFVVIGGGDKLRELCYSFFCFLKWRVFFFVLSVSLFFGWFSFLNVSLRRLDKTKYYIYFQYLFNFFWIEKKWEFFFSIRY